MWKRGVLRIGCLSLFLILAALLGCADGSPKPDDSSAVPPASATVRVIAFNDFHGYIDPPGAIKLPDPANPRHIVSEPVGGAPYLATLIRKLKAENPLNVVVGAGDMVGASPLDSALFYDEPTIQALSRMGLEFTSVGNHEFNKGAIELRRKQAGGCYSGGAIGKDTCLIEGQFSGASFRYLAANVIDENTGKPLFPPYAIKQFDVGGGRKIGIAFIGLVLRETRSMVMSSGVAGLRFTDEADAANALIPEIKAQGVNAIVVLIHQGVHTEVGFDDPSCAGANGGLLPVLDKLDPSIPLVISGHTHSAYLCHGVGTSNASVYYTSAGKYGEVLTALDVTLETARGRITDIRANNKLVVNDRAENPLPEIYPTLAPDSEIASLIAQYDVASAPLVNRVVGRIAADITTAGENVAEGGSGESALGDLIADAQLSAAGRVDPHPPVIAFMNAGGIRSNLLHDQISGSELPGQVTYGEAYNVQPFGDVLTDIDLTGAQIDALLAQQWQGQTAPKILEVSKGFSYVWDDRAPTGVSKLVEDSVRLNGKPLSKSTLYRVEVSNYLAEGGDGFSVLRAGTNAWSGPLDIEALTDYLTRISPLSPSTAGRITRRK